jgi:hypothetical protein
MGGLDIASHILSLEEMRHEENKRVNGERDILLALAPDRWTELKAAFTTECSKVSRMSSLQFKCEELDAQTFYVNRIASGVAIRALEFHFDARVPRIVWQVLWGMKRAGSLGFVVIGSQVPQVLFADGSQGVVLSEFVHDLMIGLTR